VQEQPNSFPVYGQSPSDDPKLPPSHDPKLPCCHACGAQLELKGPPSKRRLNPICPNCGEKLHWRCAWCKCKKRFLPTLYQFREANHFCCDEHANNFRNELSHKQKSTARAAARAIPRQCARKGSVYAPGLRENPELLNDCPVIFAPEKHDNQRFCCRKCQRVQWSVDNYDELSREAKKRSRLRYEEQTTRLTEAEHILAQRTLKPKGKRGRPSKTQLFIKARDLSLTQHSWPQCAEILTPEIVAEIGRKAAGERLRVGVAGLKKMRRKTPA
jgi:predicted RNA-binding Zn-ribbon protein involved in translation (DUF1610 family)